MRIDSRAVVTGVALAGLVALAGCAAAVRAPETDALLGGDAVVEQNAPLGGESLTQRRQDLRRAHGDLTHFRATLLSLHRRRDRSGLILFKPFVDGYAENHLLGLLRSEWPSEHPELMGLDANVRLMYAEVLMEMREPQRMQKVVDDIVRRFGGRESMLVDYPVGEQHTLGEALDILRNRKWRG